LDPELANYFSKKLALEVYSARDVNPILPTFGSSLQIREPMNLQDRLLTDSSRPELNRRAAAVVTAVGLAGGRPFAALPALPVAGEPLPCRLSTQDLVELLKMPTCFGLARKVVLMHLGDRYGRRFATHWEFVRFAQEQRLNLDLTSPPQRPQPPAELARP
jgi:hypothetical protein